MVNEFYTFTKDFTFCTVLRRNKNLYIPAGNFTEELESAVEDVNRDEEWRRAVMTLEMRDLENQDIGREKGVRETISTLYKKGLLSVEQAAEMLKVDQDTFLAMI